MASLLQLQKDFQDTSKFLGDLSKPALKSCSTLAHALHDKSSLKEAAHFGRHAASAFAQTLGPLDASTLSCQAHMALILQDMATPKSLEEAEELFRVVLDGYTKRGGGDDIKTLGTTNNLAVLLSQLGSLSQSELLHRRALAGFKRGAAGSPSVEVPASQFNLGVCCLALGKGVEAEAILKESLEGFRAVKGDKDPSTLAALQALLRVKKSPPSSSPPSSSSSSSSSSSTTTPPIKKKKTPA